MNPNEMWQAEVNGQIYDAAFSELATWVGENALLPNDKVRRGNLRWLEAGKVPALIPFFNAKEIGVAPPEIPVSAVSGENADKNVQIQTINFSPESDESQYSQDESPTTEFCVIHAESKAEFICETCFNNFCEICPQDVESLGKLCPICGALVKSLTGETQFIQTADFPVQNEDFTRQANGFPIQPQQQPTGNFGFGDFGRALAHPFKYKLSLVFGALMYMFFTLGQQAYAMGGAFMIFASVFSFMLANMLIFGILANVVENFSQWKTETNFMPDFDDFSMWDDVIQPFFLSIGVYLVSFGLFLAIVVLGGWFMLGSVKSEMQSIGQNSAATTMPGMNGNVDKLQQAPQLQNPAESINRQIESSQNSISNSEQQFQNMQKMIDDSSRSELNSVTESSSEAQQAQMNKIIQKLGKKALPLVILAGLAFLWGLFYIPAACAVAGYTNSFSATMNLKIGWDTIKNLGSDYAQILMMMIILDAALICIAVILHTTLSAFTIPQFGNIPAIAVTSFATFYLWIVFCCILGYAIGKKSEKLGIYHG